MLKEKGYDKFVAEQIHQGLEDYHNGRILSLEEAKLLSQQAIQNTILSKKK